MVDKGWGYQPGAESPLLKQIKTKAAKLPDPLGEALVDSARVLTKDPDAWLPDCTGSGSAALSALSDCLSPLPGQPNWKDIGRPDLRNVDDALRLSAPAMLPTAKTRADAVILLANTLGLSEQNPLVAIATPKETALIRLDAISHLVEKESDARERYANFILPTLTDPYEIWGVDYTDGVRNRYIGLFNGKRDFMTVLRINQDGSLMWNIMQASAKAMNSHRIGDLLHGK